MMNGAMGAELRPQTTSLLVLALDVANSTPNFYQIKGAGAGDHATNQYMRELRSRATSVLGGNFSEKKVCKGANYAFDFYIPQEKTAIEIALSLRNPTSEYERDIFKCLLAQDSGLELDTLVFLCKPGGEKTHCAPGSTRIRQLIKEKFGLTIVIVDLVPDYDVISALRRRIDFVDPSVSVLLPGGVSRKESQ